VPFATGKTPREAGGVLPPGKKPRSVAGEDYLRSSPVWSFALLDASGPFGWKQLKPGEFEELLERVRGWESMKWSEILIQGKRHNHPIKIGSFSKLARDRLAVIGHDEAEELLSLRVNARTRVFGILVRGTFRVLWWDPGHQVCPAFMKHT